MQTTAVAGRTHHGLHQSQDFQCGYESPDRLTVEFVHSGAFVPWAPSLLQSEPRLRIKVQEWHERGLNLTPLTK